MDNLKNVALCPMKQYTYINAIPAKVSWILGVVHVAPFSAALALETFLHGLETADDMVLLSAEFPKVLSHIATLYTRKRRERSFKY